MADLRSPLCPCGRALGSETEFGRGLCSGCMASDNRCGWSETDHEPGCLADGPCHCTGKTERCARPAAVVLNVVDGVLLSAPLVVCVEHCTFLAAEGLQ